MECYCTILEECWKFWKLSKKILENFQQISAQNLGEFFIINGNSKEKV